MTIQEKIESKLREALSPLHLEVLNESYMHSVPKGSETHFKVVIVSPEFENLRLLARHRRINEILQSEITQAIRAMSLHTLTPAEWNETQGETLKSPGCMGGSKIK